MSPGLRLRSEVFLWRHGWVWPLAAVLWLAAFALEHRARQADMHVGQLDASLRALPGARPDHAPAAPAAQTDALPIESMPRMDVPASVTRMLSLAQAAGIELAQAEYQHAAHPSLRMTQTQVLQPVRATYPQLRRYLEAVLLELPHVSLDHVSARRDPLAPGQLEVRLRWSLWASIATPTDSANADARGP